MGKTPTTCRTGTTRGPTTPTCLSIQAALAAGITSWHMCKLPVQTPAEHSPLFFHPQPWTSHWNTSLLSCISFEGSSGARKSLAMPASPGKNPSPCPIFADAQTSFQTAAGTTKLCVCCTIKSRHIWWRTGDKGSALRVPAHLTSAEKDRSNFQQIPTWTGIYPSLW